MRRPRGWLSVVVFQSSLPVSASSAWIVRTASPTKSVHRPFSRVTIGEVRELEPMSARQWTQPVAASSEKTWPRPVETNRWSPITVGWP